MELAIPLQCPVRGCGEPLERVERVLRCPRAHSFDLARSGYSNLLQPQDRRSKRAGDDAGVLAARRRWHARGLGAGLLAALRAWTEELAHAPGARVLESGCGDG